MKDEDHPCATTIIGVLCNEVSIPVYHEFQGFNPVERDGSPVSTSFLTIPRLDAWIVTVVQLLVPRESRGGGRQKIFSDRFMNNFNIAVDQFVGRVREFVQYWAPHKLQIPYSDVPSYKGAILSTKRDITMVLFSEKFNIFFISVRHDWFSKFITPQLGSVHDCYIAKIEDDFKSIVLLGETVPEKQLRQSSLEQLEQNESIEQDEGLTECLIPAPTTVPPK